MTKDHINAKIFEALSASLGDWEKMECDGRYCSHETVEKHYIIFAAEKQKLESKIKSALETIDWGDEISGSTNE